MSILTLTIRISKFTYPPHEPRAHSPIAKAIRTRETRLRYSCTVTVHSRRIPIPVSRRRQASGARASPSRQLAARLDGTLSYTHSTVQYCVLRSTEYAYSLLALRSSVVRFFAAGSRVPLRRRPDRGRDPADVTRAHLDLLERIASGLACREPTRDATAAPAAEPRAAERHSVV